MQDFPGRLRATFATIARPLTPEDGESEANIASAEDRLGLKLPSVLRDYFVLAGRFDQFNQAHNRLLRPEEWSVDSGKLVFLTENQGVCAWGLEASRSPGSDPPVFQGASVEDQPSEWFLEHATCSEFLLVTLHLQAVWGGYEALGGAEEVDSRRLERFLAGWTPVGRVNDVRAFHREGGVACVLEVDDGTSQVFVGGRSEPDFAAIVTGLKAVGIKIERL